MPEVNLTSSWILILIGLCIINEYPMFMKHFFLFLATIIMSVSCGTIIEGGIELDESPAGYAALPYRCDLAYQVDGVDQKIQSGSIDILQLSPKEISITMKWSRVEDYDQSYGYTLNTEVSLEGDIGNVTICGEYGVTLKRESKEQYIGKALIEGYIRNNTYLQTKDPTKYDVEGTVVVEYTQDGHTHTMRCYNLEHRI